MPNSINILISVYRCMIVPVVWSIRILVPTVQQSCLLSIRNKCAHHVNIDIFGVVSHYICIMVAFGFRTSNIWTVLDFHIPSSMGKLQGYTIHHMGSMASECEDMSSKFAIIWNEHGTHCTNICFIRIIYVWVSLGLSVIRLEAP